MLDASIDQDDSERSCHTGTYSNVQKSRKEMHALWFVTGVATFNFRAGYLRAA